MPTFVSVESPYSAPTQGMLFRNQAYAMLCTQYATVQGCASFPSHLINTTHWLKFIAHGCNNPYVADQNPYYHVVGRDAAIAMTHAARRKCDACWFFLDFGESSGMAAARKMCEDAKIPTRDIYLRDTGVEWCAAVDNIVTRTTILPEPPQCDDRVAPPATRSALKCVPQHYPCGGATQEDEYNPWTETLQFGERPTAKWPTAEQAATDHNPGTEFKVRSTDDSWLSGRSRF